MSPVSASALGITWFLNKVDYYYDDDDDDDDDVEKENQ